MIFQTRILIETEFTIAEQLHCYPFSWRIHTKNWTTAQILTILKRTVIQTYNSAK